MSSQQVATSVPVAKTVSAPAGHTRRIPTAAPALQVLDLGKGFRSGLLRRRLRGIDGISLSVQPGEIFALLGHNGAGKTTTINCILDLCRVETGEITIFGLDHHDPASRRRVGYLPERPYFFDHLTGTELLRFYARLLDLPTTGLDARIARVLARVDMSDRAQGRLNRMSKGMLQRMGLAQAILGDADLLILDEPMSGLDPLGRRDVRELLLELKSGGTTILLSSHIVPDVEMLADQVGILKDGRLARTCSRRELAGEAAYLIEAACPAGEPSAWPEWLVTSGAERLADRLRFQAPDTIALREVLEYCHNTDLTVHSVESRRSGLEEVFMAVHENVIGGREAAR